MKCFWWTPLLLGACVVSRPYGSFDEPPEPTDRDGGSDESGEGDEGPATGSVPIPRSDAGMRDAGDAEPLPPDSPFAPYVGTYLMRMDMYSKVSTTIATTTIAVSNRISNLVLTELRVEGDQLVGQETFCHQTYAHNCSSGCVDNWTTEGDPGLAKLYPNAQATRTYRLEGDSVVADESIVALGFTDTNVSATTKLPVDASDARLWKPKNGSVGVVTRMRAKARVGSITQPFDCELSTVQLFGSAFEGAKGEGEAPLEGVTLALTVNEKLPASALAAAGTPPFYCNTKALGEQPAEAGPAGNNLVRFRKTDIVGECPSVQVFDEQLPADAP